jgi:hypothetical protein
MSLTRSVAVLVTLLAVSPAAAQEQRASLEGTIRDASGAPVAGARVEVRNVSGFALSGASDGSGRYRFPSLPPGTYRMRATLPGFAAAHVPEVRLSLGQILAVNLGLPTGGVTEAVTVTAEAPLIDVRQSARATSFREEQLTRLPRGRDYTSVVDQAPGANPEGADEWRSVYVDGASGNESRYLVDGVDTTHVMHGNAGLRLVTDVVEEIQVKSSGYAAEYGGATGGVVNVITQSGSNRWMGDARVYYTNDALQGRSRPFLLSSVDGTTSEYHRFPKDSFSRWEPGFSLGGPLRKDAVWVFAGLSPVLESTERTVLFSANGVRRTFSNSDRTYNGNVNLTARLGQKTQARAAVNLSPHVQDGTLPFVHGRGNPNDDFGIVTRHPGRAVSGEVDYVAGAHLLLTARAGSWLVDTRQEGVFQGPIFGFQTSNEGMPGVPVELQRPRGSRTALTNFEFTRNIFTRVSGQLDGTLYLSARGRHAVKLGVQIERLGNDTLHGDTGNVVLLFWGRSFAGQQGRFGHYSVRSNPVLPQRGLLTVGDVHSHNVGLFVQDAWTIADRLTLNLGLRAERENVPSYTSEYGIGPTAIDFGFGDKLAPRLGAAWDVRGDGKWKAYGSWGFFYDKMKYVLARNSLGGTKWLVYYYTLDRPDWPNLLPPGCPPACPGTLIQGPVDLALPANIPGRSAIDPDIDPFRMQERVLGLEHELSPRVSLGLRYVHKQVDTAVEDIGARDAAGNQVYIIGNPGFHRAAQTGYGPAFPKAVRDYDALELTVDKRLADRWGFRASYLLSRLYGNYDGLAEGGEGQFAANLTGTFNNPIMMFGHDGRPLLGVLSSDRTHQLKAQAMADFAFGTSVGASARLLSGTPVTRYAPFIEGHGYSVAYAGRGSDGRLPALSQIDLYLQHEIRLRGRKRLQVGVNVMNLLDQDAPVQRYVNELWEPVRIDEAAFFRGFSGEALIAAQGLERDPNFAKDYVYQLPREIRLSLRLAF